MTELAGIVSEKRERFDFTWRFSGTRAFVQQSDSPELVKYRDWLVALLTALENGNRRATLDGLDVSSP